MQHFLDLTDKFIVEEQTRSGIGHHLINIAAENGE